METAGPFQVQIRTLSEDPEAPLIYERYETVIPITDLVHEKKFRQACEICPNYRKNLSCPPYSPCFEEYLGALNTARVICIRIPQETFQDLPPDRRYRKSFKKARGLLGRELHDYRKNGFQVAGSGACRACPVCAIVEGEEQCRKPELRLYSLESLGTNLTALTRRCFNFDLEWSSHDQAADFVCAIGAVFY